MVLGNAGQKIQTIIELAEEVYEKVTEVREQLVRMRDAVDGIDERVQRVERETTEQRALVEAIAEAQGIDTEAVLAEVDAEDGPDPGSPPEEGTTAERETTEGATAEKRTTEGT